MSPPSLDMPLEERAQEEQRRTSMASTFDRLVESNLDLTRSVGRLVVVSYVLVFIQLAAFFQGCR